MAAGGTNRIKKSDLELVSADCGSVYVTVYLNISVL